ncbi:MAG: penicillin-binding transpeptidase domain-containing protein, partial [Candidatus Hydrogenedentota bacterium]
DRDGFTRYQTSPTGEEAFKEDVAYLMTYLMQGVAERGTGARTSALDRPRAGKTGTSNNNVDVWFCGYTPQFTSVVWVGYREGSRRLGSGANYTGGRVAAPIWTDFMIKAHEGLPEHDFRVPEGVEFHDIDRQTGQAGGSFREAFIRDTEPLPSQPRREEPEEAPGEGEFEFRSISAEDMIRDEF